MPSEVVINTKLGQIKGVQSSNVLNKANLFSFLGIPYAAPPTGNLRFKPPQLHPGWEGILDASKEGGMCAQLDAMHGAGLCGGDDCLYLNVYSSNVEPGTKHAVMVFVHGGGFTFGNSSPMFYGSDLLVAKDVVLVTLNYRLNIFGFLNLGLDDCPGNAGLRDIIAALEWVKSNISDFGGDPKNVTLFGESAGSASVHYLMMAPKAKGLFHRAILQSGTALDTWAHQSSQESKENAVAVAKHLGCQSEDPVSVLEFLRNVPALDLIKPQNQVVVTPEKIRTALVFPFVPSPESVGPPEERVVWDNPVSMLTQTHSIPFLCGINSQEGLILLKHGASTVDKLLDTLDKDFERVVPRNLNAEGAKEKLIAGDIKRFYFGSSPVNVQKINQYFDLYSDLLFTLGHYGTMSMISKLKPGQAYGYVFSFEGELNVFKKLVLQGLEFEVPGACHVDELGYLFYIAITGMVPEPGSPEEKASENIRSLWTNFAKTGVPHMETFSSWNPCTQQDVSHLNINETLSVHQGFPFPARYDFWKQLYSTYASNFLKGNL